MDRREPGPRDPARNASDPLALVPLTPAVFHIMLALATQELHGYGIMLEVERLTAGRTRLGPGTLYRSIQRMLVERLIEESEAHDDDDEDERRRYYRLTELGHAVAREEARRLSRLVRAARTRGLLGRPTARGTREVRTPTGRAGWTAR